MLDWLWGNREVVALALFAAVFITAFALCDHFAQRAAREELGEREKGP